LASSWTLTATHVCVQSIPRSILKVFSLDKTKWSAKDYVDDLTKRATGQNLPVEAKLLKKYPPIFSPTTYHLAPSTVQDEDGNLMLWYIPGALTTQRAVSSVSLFFCRAPGVDRGVINKTQMWQDLFMLQRSIRINSGCTGWRASQTFFRAEGGWLKPGSVSMAPAWFQQAHEVRTSNMKVKQ